MYAKIVTAAMLFLLLSCNMEKDSTSFVANWPDSITRTWIGRDFWANRLQDWEISDGRIECLVANSNRNVNLITCEVAPLKGNLYVSTDLGIFANIPANEKNWVGFRIGAKGQFNDYRDNAVFGQGLNVGITTSGDLFIGDVPDKSNGNINSLVPFLPKGVRLNIEATPNNDNYLLTLLVIDISTKEILATIEKEMKANDIEGSIALVSDFPNVAKDRNFRSCWFDNWSVSGDKVIFHPERAFGPILFSQYTLSRGTLKISAQMPPISVADGNKVFMQIKKDNKWEMIGKSTIDPSARTATITINNWDYKIDVSYKLSYTYISNSGERQLKFLDNWAKDWSNHTWMKVVLSQTIFAAVNTKSKTDYLNAQRRKVLKVGEYPPDDMPTVDLDTNGWPQIGRNKAVKMIRKAFAFHLAGDQHLGSVIQYGVDEFGDAGYAFCVPSISNMSELT